VEERECRSPSDGAGCVWLFVVRCFISLPYFDDPFVQYLSLAPFCFQSLLLRFFILFYFFGESQEIFLLLVGGVRALSAFVFNDDMLIYMETYIYRQKLGV
jgi:hypothetical protein